MTMEKNKFDWKGFRTGLKSIFARNTLLIICVSIFNQYGNAMKNGFRSLYGTGDLGLAPQLIGVAMTVFTIATILGRLPGGILTDVTRNKLKYILAGSLILKGSIWMLFPLVHNATGYYIVFFIDGVVWSFVTTVVPACLAICVDRRAMGTAYAVYSGMVQFCTGTAKSLGISLLNEYGITMACGVACATGIIAAGIALCLDGNKMAESVASANSHPGISQEKQKKRRSLLSSGICVKMIPFCLVAGMPVFMYQMELNYFQIYAESTGLPYLGALSLGGTIAGITNIAIGIVCDIVNPTFVIVICLLGQIAAPICWAGAESGFMVGLGVVLFYATRCYMTAFRVIGMKLVKKEEQGAYSSTISLGNDLFSVLCNLIIGSFVGLFGYAASFYAVAIWCTIALVAFLIMDKTILRKLRKDVENDELKTMQGTGSN